VQHCHGRIRAEIMEERNLISKMGVDRSLFAAYRCSLRPIRLHKWNHLLKIFVKITELRTNEM